MNIILVCSYFGPETSCGVNRVNSMTRHWLDLGHSVDVVTMPYAADLPVYLKNKPGLIVHQVPPVISLKKNKKTPQSHSNISGRLGKIIKNIFYFTKKYFFANYLDLRILWWPSAAVHAQKIARDRNSCFIFTSVPSYTAHSVGAVVKKRCPKIYWVADYRDLWSGNPIFPGNILVRALERWHEKFIVKKADMLVTINQHLGNHLMELHGRKKLLIVPNGFEDLESSNPLIVKSAETKYRTIVYTGTVLTGLQNPEPLFEAAFNLFSSGRLNVGALKIYFYGDASAIKNTRNFISLIASGIVELKGVVSRLDSIRAQQGADLLLFLGARKIKDGASITGVVSGKIFEYLVSGTEIMAVGVSDDMVVADMIRQANVGDIYNEDIHKIETRLLSLVSDGAKKIQVNQDYLAKFRRKNQAIYLLSEIQKEISIKLRRE